MHLYVWDLLYFFSLSSAYFLSLATKAKPFLFVSSAFLLSVLLEFVMEIGNWDRFLRYLEDLKSPQLFSELCGRAASCTLHSPLLCQALLPPFSSVQLPTVPLPFPISLEQTPIMYHDLRHAPG